jgi:hypothetical protein
MSVQDSINKLLWNQRFVLIPPEIQRPEDLDYVIIKDLTLEDRNHYMFVRDSEELLARQRDGVPTEGELIEQARQADYWTPEDDIILEEASNHIAYLESEIDAKKKFPSRIKILRKQIEEAREQQTKAERKKHELYAVSAECYAHEIAAYEMVIRCVCRPDGTLLISDDALFLLFKQRYTDFMLFLVQEVMSEGVMSNTDAREIARSPEWRLVWTLVRENLGSIFNRPVGDLTLNHKIVVYWSRVYDSALESTEPPDQDIIEDDDKFDQWLANRDLGVLDRKSGLNDHQEQMMVLDGEYIERCTCGAKEANKNTKGLGEKQSHALDCPYGTWHRYSPEEKEQLASQVYSRNRGAVRQMLDDEQEVILKKGVIEDQHLRNQKTRQIYGMPTKVTTITK